MKPTRRIAFTSSIFRTGTFGTQMTGVQMTGVQMTGVQMTSVQMTSARMFGRFPQIDIDEDDYLSRQSSLHSMYASYVQYDDMVSQSNTSECNHFLAGKEEEEYLDTMSMLLVYGRPEYPEETIETIESGIAIPINPLDLLEEDYLDEQSRWHARCINK
jgi:hypothetical protein